MSVFLHNFSLIAPFMAVLPSRIFTSQRSLYHSALYVNAFQTAWFSQLFIYFFFSYFLVTYLILENMIHPHITNN